MKGAVAGLWQKKIFNPPPPLPTDNTQTAPQTVAANDYAASSGLSRWKGIYNIVESVKEAEEEEEYEEEDAMVIVDTPMRTASPTHHHVKNTSFDKVKMAGSALKQKWSAKFREMPSLVPLLERLVVNEKKQSESNASSQTLSQQQQKPRPIDAPVPKVSSKRASSAGMMFLKSPAPIIAKFLGKEKHQQPPPQQQQLHHTPIKVDDVKGKTLSYVNRSNSSSVRSVEKLRATNVALAVSDEAPDFFSDELVKSGEEAKRQFESKYLVSMEMRYDKDDVFKFNLYKNRSSRNN